jgi:hypothetical protein
VSGHELQPMKQRLPPRLEAGERFRLHADCGDPRLYEVLAVSDGGATVRCTIRTHEAFQTADGTDVAFDKPGRRFRIAAHASVIRVRKIGGL